MPSDAALLEDILDRMLALILAADVAGLAPLSAEAIGLLERMPGVADAGAAQRLRAKADRNALCLAASARGLRAAQRRIAEICAMRDGGAPLVTYDGRGQRAEAATMVGRLTRRI